jgi:hypothetical protein
MENLENMKGKRLREFSFAGPCLELGTVTKATPNSVEFTEHGGRIRRRGGSAWNHVSMEGGLGSGLLHVEPCRRCMDHPETSYPRGYEN